MKNALRHYAPVAGLLAGIGAAAVLLTYLAGGGAAVKARPTVVTTVYPLYVAACTVAGDSDGVQVEGLTGTPSGCLHDYQLSPTDRIVLGEANLVLLNGAGSEAFLDGLPLTAKTVDTSLGVELVCAHHTHTHPDGGEEQHEEAPNEHVWTSPRRYGQQVEAVITAFCELDPAREDIYRRNGDEYLQKIRLTEQRLLDCAVSLQGKRCVLFHESLAYLAQDLGLMTEAVLTAGEEGGVSAAELAMVQRLAQTHPDLLLLYDSQYPLRYAAVDELVPAAQVLALETGVTGQSGAADWLQAMEKNAALLERLTEE